MLAQKDDALMTSAEKNQQIKQITQELLDRLNSSNAQAEGSPTKLMLDME